MTSHGCGCREDGNANATKHILQHEDDDEEDEEDDDDEDETGQVPEDSPQKSDESDNEPAIQSRSKRKVSIGQLQ